MKLFIWNQPYRVNYGSSMVFAVADDVETAKRLACSKLAVTLNYGSRSPDHPNQRNWSAMTLGEPDEILDCPCAVWDEWSE